MNIKYTIARRYLLGKKTTNAINLITWISIIGISIGTAALILILSVFNGFDSLLSGLFNAYNPDIKVTTVTGKYLDIDSIKLSEVMAMAEVEAVSRVLEEVALFEYKGNQEAGYIKGVDDGYQKVTNIDSIIVRGEFMMSEKGINYCILGSGMYNKLNVNASDALTPLTVYMPLVDQKGPFAKDYRALDIHPRAIFSAGSEDDAQYIIASYDFVNNLLNQTAKISSLEIKLKADAQEKDFRVKLESIIGSNLQIKNRYQQDEAFLKIMNIEKWVSYLIASLTLCIISFNLIGSLWMIVLDKRKDISILRSMGLTSQEVKSIFIYVGLLIGAIGLVIGIVVALVLYFFQRYYDLIAIPSGFMIDSYPIGLKWRDFIVVSITVIVISFLASLLPAIRASKITAFIRAE